MIGTTVFDLELSLRERSRDDERPGLDSIGDDRMLGAAERFNAFDLNRLGSGAIDTSAHLVQQIG